MVIVLSEEASQTSIRELSTRKWAAAIIQLHTRAVMCSVQFGRDVLFYFFSYKLNPQNSAAKFNYNETYDKNEF